MHSFDILASKNGVIVDDVLSADVRLRVSIELSGLVREVEVDGVGPGEGDCDILVVGLEEMSEE